MAARVTHILKRETYHRLNLGLIFYLLEKRLIESQKSEPGKPSFLKKLEHNRLAVMRSC